MTNTTNKHSSAWQNFTALSFGIAAKGFYAMASIMLVHTTVTLTKTLRDKQESELFHNRIEDAKTEKLLKEVSE